MPIDTQRFGKPEVPESLDLRSDDELIDHSLDHDSRLKRRITARVELRDLKKKQIADSNTALAEEASEIPPENRDDERPSAEDYVASHMPVVDHGRQKLLKILCWSLGSAALIFLVLACGLGLGMSVYKNESLQLQQRISLDKASIIERDQLIMAIKDESAQQVNKNAELTAKALEIAGATTRVQEEVKEQAVQLATKNREVELVNQDFTQSQLKLSAEIEARLRADATVKQLTENLAASEKARARIKATYDEIVDEAQASRVKLSEQAKRLREFEGNESLIKGQLQQAVKELAAQSVTETQLRKENEDLRKAILTGR